MLYPARPTSQPITQAEWTPVNPFSSGRFGVSEDAVDALTKPQAEAHAHQVLSSHHGIAQNSYYPPQHGYIPPRETLESSTLLRLMDCVKPRGERSELGRQGCIGIGPFYMDTEDFTRTMVKEKPQKGQDWHVYDAMADALGARSFANLKVVELFQQSHEWLQDHINASPSQSDIAVWRKMDTVIGRVEEAFVTAMQVGLVDEKAANNVIHRAEARTRELGAPMKDWAAPVTALLDGVTETTAMLQSRHPGREADWLGDVVRDANRAYQQAKVPGGEVELLQLARPQQANKAGLTQAA